MIRQYLVKHKGVCVCVSISIPGFIRLILDLEKGWGRETLKIGVKKDFLRLKRSDMKSQFLFTRS